MSSEMNHHSNKIEETLQGLDGMHRAKAPAFFYTRLKARLEREYGSGPVVRLLTRPALALTVAVIVLVLNAAVITQLWQKETPAVATENSPVIAADYSMGNYPVYDENTPDE